MNRSSFRHVAVAIGTTLVSLTATLPAHAHHATGRPPETMLEGLLSGVAHPLIGADHLLFLLLLGGLVARAGTDERRRTAAMAAAGSVIGAVVHLFGINLPAVEPAVAVSIIGAGALIVMRRRPTPLSVIAVAAVFHGYAFAESAVGAPLSVFGAYLLGLTVTQVAIVLGVARLDRVAGTDPIDTDPASLRPDRAAR